MKNKNLIPIVISLFVLAIMYSCGRDDNPLPSGTVEFSYAIVNQNSGGRVMAAEDAAFIVVTIEDAGGTEVYSQEQLEVLNFNGTFITTPLSLEVGSYNLTEYLILDANLTVIYSTPLAGSPLAYLVTNPLPINFVIGAGQEATVIPEVLSTENVSAQDFGYSGFTFTIVETFDFLMGVFVYDDGAGSYQLTDADVSITGDGTPVYSDEIAAETDQIRVLDGQTNYTISVSKLGYVDLDTTVTNAALQANLNNPLQIFLTPLLNGSLDFDGSNDHIDIPAMTSVTDSLTIETWLNPSKNAFAMVRMQQEDLDELPSWMFTINGSDNLIFGINTTSGYTQLQIAINPVTYMNSWHHYAAVYNGTNMYLYIDGVQVASKSHTGNVIYSSDPIFHWIGGAPYLGGHGFFGGNMDEVRIWESARSATQIANNYNSTLMGTEVGLLGYYNFDEGSGTSATDLSPNGNHGTLTNMDETSDWETDVPF